MLENACFACPENEAHLAALMVTTTAVGGPGGCSKELALAEWVVQQVEQLGHQGLSGGFKKVGLQQGMPRSPALVHSVATRQ